MRLPKQTVLLVIAALFAAFAAVAVRSRLSEAPPAVEVPQAQIVRVMIAKRDLSAGTFVQGAQDLDWAVLPDHMAKRPSAAPSPAPVSENEAASSAENESVTEMEAGINDNYFYEGAVNLTDFNGAVVRRSLRTGEPVPQAALTRSGEGGFMSAVLGNGMRAMTIAVNATSGNGGFVSPGDHVDLIVTQRLKTQEANNTTSEIVVGETFIEDIRVVAVDQMIDNPENKAILAKTVTVEVTPKQAEQIAVASEMGTISVALRSINQTERKDAEKSADAVLKPENPTVGDLYENPANNAPPAKVAEEYKGSVVPRVTIIRGDKSESIDFYQGRP